MLRSTATCSCQHLSLLLEISRHPRLMLSVELVQLSLASRLSTPLAKEENCAITTPCTLVVDLSASVCVAPLPLPLPLRAVGQRDVLVRDAAKGEGRPQHHGARTAPWSGEHRAGQVSRRCCSCYEKPWPDRVRRKMGKFGKMGGEMGGWVNLVWRQRKGAQSNQGRSCVFDMRLEMRQIALEYARKRATPA